MDEPPDVATLVSSLDADSESARKYAVFKLKGLLSDPSFADAFIQNGGLPALRQAVLDTTGNTQAYALGSLDALLELDMGWECCDHEILQKALSLAISHPLVNIVRNALTLLVLIVSRPIAAGQDDESSGVYGFRAIKPALDHHPQFLESLVQRLSASDHTLCANALQLVNALMRDAVLNGGEHQWPMFVHTLQDLGVIGGVGMLMRGDAANYADSPLAFAILEFQDLTKILLRKWRDVMVNMDLAEHKRALKTIHLLSKPEPYSPPVGANGVKGRKHHPEKWRRLGFETESPAWEFDETGYLGMMDLVEYTRRHEDTYQKTLSEQAAIPREQRCPIARASLCVTLVLYELFEIDDSTVGGPPGYRNSFDRAQSVDRLYKPLLLQWGRLHAAALNTFIRLWKDAGAEHQDIYKIEEVVRIVVERVIGTAGRKTDIARVEDDLRLASLESARKWQMENLDDVYQDAWGPHLVEVHEQLRNESLQFMREQRIRCLLQGSWFPTSEEPDNTSWQFVRLSHNRRWLHYQTFSHREETTPSLAELPLKIETSKVTSVDSNISAPKQTARNEERSSDTLAGSARSGRTSITKLTIMGTPETTRVGGTDRDERVLLELYIETTSLASEWLDGLLMLLDQQPITKDTARLVSMLEDWGVRLRMLNLRWEDVDWEALESSAKDENHEFRPVPSREGIEDGDFWYALPDEQ
ncbi:Putative pleckstrin domain, ELMO domain, armadillo-like helical, PH-like domain superfamily [Septoria linicola]|uniref:Pleckstrin domain, ELMO domain, armadillo-like helical, PH-like domain superfamily n=1 Tax=Septoria linicola TaxID=215465 RepID=A0A9Q9AIU4_9PEZI|nr:putative pleckstrin domain, ELMO domain, armadillo-like helical, PH-like domain superfamily [Septoria linicola]USW46978.1 Putative pleckstrin domain, ELMO domain, armadillo-like helical, PH-like domain superfamily [Septoria linicola]